MLNMHKINIDIYTQLDSATPNTTLYAVSATVMMHDYFVQGLIVRGCVQCRHLNSSSLTTLVDCDKTFKVISNVEDIRKWNIILSR